MDTKDQNLKRLEEFFKRDMNIKTALMQIAPREIDDYDEESRIKYIDMLYKELNHFEKEFKNIVESFGLGQNVLNSISEYFEKAKKEFLMKHYDKGMINSVYKRLFSNMDEKLIETIKEQFVGYTSYGNLSEVISQSKSINELLHAFHSYITNNEGIMQSLPIIDSKTNEFGYPIVLSGEQTEMARNMFSKFPLNMDVGYTDIVSMKDKILMMVRDRGHALTIEIDKEKDGAVFRYFIPKLCNREMVEKLPGINKITESGATGIFKASENEINEKLFNFIGKVPMDSDIVIDWNKIFAQATEQKEKSAIFGKNQAKEVAIGRRTRGIRKIQEMLQKGKKFTKEKGDYDDEQSIGDK